MIDATPNIGSYVIVPGVAIIAPRVAASGFLVIAVAGVRHARGDEASKAKTVEPG